MMTEVTLKARISELKSELEKKNREIHSYLDRIDELEETIMRLEALIPEEDIKKKSKKKQVIDSKMAIQLDEKDKQIRELKNNMGFLRKDKIKIQLELERLKANQKESSVIRVEDLRTQSPLNTLVKELQETVNKQRSTINKLKAQNIGNEELIEKMSQKDEEIEILKSDIFELNQKLKDLSTISDERSHDSISKKLIEDLQNQLNKAKRQLIDFKQKLDKSDKKSKKLQKEAKKIDDFKTEIKELKGLVETKELEIKELNEKVKSLKKAEIDINYNQIDTPSNEMIKALKEDLQNKLNKAKLQIKSLQEEIKEKSPEPIESQKDLEGKLKKERDMAVFLQKQLETKEGEIATIKNEAVQIKRKYRHLENQLRSKEQKLNDFQSQLDSFNIQSQVQTKKEDPNLGIRIKELKNKVENLQKLNNEQRIEISQLRKKV
jgi:chromosome segregation ATPase